MSRKGTCWVCRWLDREVQVVEVVEVRQLRLDPSIQPLLSHQPDSLWGALHRGHPTV